MFILHGFHITGKAILILNIGKDYQIEFRRSFLIYLGVI
jgi:hypothetical protein